MQTGDQEFCLVFVKWVWEHIVPRKDHRAFCFVEHNNLLDNRVIAPVKYTRLLNAFNTEGVCARFSCS